jgi:hypothetical protein
MFHADRVNFEAVLFDNWALSRIHNFLIVNREQIVRSHLSWLLNLPCGIEVCASTAMRSPSTAATATTVPPLSPPDSGTPPTKAAPLSPPTTAPLRIHTAVAACAVFYEDFETTAVKSSFTLQFHPELCDDIMVVGDRDKDGRVYRPSFQDLKQSDGVQLLCRMLHVNSQIS